MEHGYKKLFNRQIEVVLLTSGNFTDNQALDFIIRLAQIIMCSLRPKKNATIDY